MILVWLQLRTSEPVDQSPQGNDARLEFAHRLRPDAIVVYGAALFPPVPEAVFATIAAESITAFTPVDVGAKLRLVQLHVEERVIGGLPLAFPRPAIIGILALVVQVEEPVSCAICQEGCIMGLYHLRVIR